MRKFNDLFCGVKIWLRAVSFGLIIIISSSLFLPAIAQDSKPHSQAFNNFSSLLHEEVIPNTGSLVLTKPLVTISGVSKNIGLNINLMYQHGVKGILQLPNNWIFDISYVVPGRSFTCQGKTWIIDEDWSDIEGYRSGLRYENNHGVKFETLSSVQSLPSGNSDKYGKYKYKFTYKDGSHDYFDEGGKLIGHDDRFGNYINYLYKESRDDVFSAQLVYIIDSYNQKITFDYDLDNREITITLPDGSKKIINYYSDDGVKSIKEELGNETNFDYASGGRVSNIKYATGLETRIEYTSIVYKTNAGKGSFPAVSDLIHCGVGSGECTGDRILDHTSYNFGFDTFTGYNAGCSLSSNSDGLMECEKIDPSAYSYNVTISKSGQDDSLLARTIVSYNYLHLPKETHHYLFDRSKSTNVSKLTGECPKDANNSNMDGFYEKNHYILDREERSRTTNYNKPSVIENLVWSQDVGYITLKITNRTIKDKYGRDIIAYDAYGNLLFQEIFTYDPISKKLIPQSSTANAYAEVEWDNNKHTMPHSVTHQDLITKYTKQTNYKLTDDQKNISSKSLEYNKDGGSNLQPWKTTNYTYDPQGRIKATTLSWSDDNHPGIQSTTKSYGYNYDANSGLLGVTTTDALGHQTIKTYDERIVKGPLVKTQNAVGETTSYTYDLLGRMTSKIDPMNNKTAIDYYLQAKDGYNGKIVTNPLNYKKAEYYDALGRKIETKDNGDPTNPSDQPNRSLGKIIYNCLGKMAQKINKLGLITSYEYDSLGRKIKTTDPLNNVHTMDYDDANLTTTSYINDIKHKVEKKDGAGRVISADTYPDSDGTINYYLNHAAQYNGFGQVLKKSSNKINTATQAPTPLGTVSYVYDLDKKVVTKNFIGFEGGGNKAQYSKNMIYDLLGKKIFSTKSVAYSDGRNYTINSDKHSYNEVGDLVSETNALGYKKEYTYDDVGRLSQKVKIGADESKITYNYSYDKNGNLLSMQHDGGEISYSYYADNKKKSTTNENATINYEYYLDGNLKTVGYSDGKSKSYSLDRFSRMTSMTDEAGSTTKFAYNAQGLLDSKQYNSDSLKYSYGTVHHVNGVLVELDLQGSSPTKRNYYYDGFGKISREQLNDASQKILLNTSYTRDALGRLIQLNKSSEVSASSDLNFTRAFKYDGINQLISVHPYSIKHPDNTIGYTYDGNGNVLKKTETGKDSQDYTYNEIDQMISPAITYDSFGRVTKDDLGFNYTYNELDQLIEISDSGNSALHSYSYYPDGLLLDRTDSAANTKQHYYYRKGHVNSILSTDSAGNDEEWKTFLFNGKERIGAYTDAADQSPSYYITAKGSTSAILKDGNFTSVDYDPYGKVKGDGLALGDGASPEFLWNQELHEAKPGLVYLRARFYNPRLMRFMTMDSYPVENKYSYGNADPINMIDPSGHFSWKETLAGIGILAVGALATAVCPGLAPTLIGAGLSGLIYGATDKGDHWGKFGIAVGIGAATGFLTGGVSGASSGIESYIGGGIPAKIVTRALAGSVIGAGGGALEALINHDDVGLSIFAGAMLGAGVGAYGGALGGIGAAVLFGTVGVVAGLAISESQSQSTTGEIIVPTEEFTRQHHHHHHHHQQQQQESAVSTSVVELPSPSTTTGEFVSPASLTEKLISPAGKLSGDVWKWVGYLL